MKSLTILALLAASALAVYSPGQKCNTNTECNEECFEARWTIAAQDDGSFASVCDPTDTKWYHGTCYTDDVRSKGNPQYTGDETSNACEKRGGTMCSRQCVLSSKQADDSVLRQQCRRRVMTKARMSPISRTSARKMRLGCSAIRKGVILGRRFVLVAACDCASQLEWRWLVGSGDFGCWSVAKREEALQYHACNNSHRAGASVYSMEESRASNIPSFPFPGPCVCDDGRVNGQTRRGERKTHIDFQKTMDRFMMMTVQSSKSPQIIGRQATLQISPHNHGKLPPNRNRSSQTSRKTLPTLAWLLCTCGIFPYNTNSTPPTFLRNTAERPTHP